MDEGRVVRQLASVPSRGCCRRCCRRCCWPSSLPFVVVVILCGAVRVICTAARANRNVNPVERRRRRPAIVTLEHRIEPQQQHLPNSSIASSSIAAADSQAAFSESPQPTQNQHTQTWYTKSTCPAAPSLCECGGSGGDNHHRSKRIANVDLHFAFHILQHRRQPRHW